MSLQQSIVERATTLPTCRETLCGLRAVAQKSGSDRSDFESVFKADPAFAANLLRLANTAHFGCHGRVGTVAQALSLIGLDLVTKLATGANMAEVIRSDVEADGVVPGELWRHSLTVATLAEALAENLDDSDRELAYTAGLLHDMGKLAVIGNQSDSAHPCVTARLDHGELGASLVRSWGFPPVLEHALRWHHQPHLAPRVSSSRLVGLVHAANVMAHGRPIQTTSVHEKIV